MAVREWIEMPVVGHSEDGDQIVPKYTIETNAVLVYRGPKVYVALEDETARNEMVRYPDVHLLTLHEARELEDGLPFPLPLPSLHDARSNPRRLLLGDVVSWLTHKLGIEECTGCQKRKRWLNRVVIWGWRRK